VALATDALSGLKKSFFTEPFSRAPKRFLEEKQNAEASIARPRRFALR